MGQDQDQGLQMGDEGTVQPRVTCKCGTEFTCTKDLFCWCAGVVSEARVPLSVIPCVCKDCLLEEIENDRTA